MVAFLVLLPVLLIVLPILAGWWLERARESVFNQESRQLRDRSDREFWLHDSVVTHLISSFSTEAA